LGGCVLYATLILCFFKANLDAVKASYSNYLSSMKLCRKNCSGFGCKIAFHFSDKRLLHDAINDVKVESYGFLFFIAWSIGTECSINLVCALSGKINYFLCPRHDSLCGARKSLLSGFTIRFRYTTLSRTPLDKWSARPRPLPYNTKHSQQTSMSLGWIRTHIPSERAAADPRLRSRGHRDWWL